MINKNICDCRMCLKRAPPSCKGFLCNRSFAFRKTHFWAARSFTPLILACSKAEHLGATFDPCPFPSFLSNPGSPPQVSLILVSINKLPAEAEPSLRDGALQEKQQRDVEEPEPFPLRRRRCWRR